MPIRELSPYTNGRWRIKARVIMKGDVRKFSNARGEGQLLKVDLADQSGEIGATFFGKAVDKFKDVLVQGRVFSFQKGMIKAANPRFEKGDHIINFEDYSVIDPVDEDDAIPVLQYEWNNLTDIDTIALNTFVDIKAVVHDVQDPFTFTARTSNKEMTKRSLGLWDPSGPDRSKTIEMTLWDTRAQQSFDVGSVVFLKGVRIGEWNGNRNISSPQNLEVNPDSPEAFQLKAQYEEQQRTKPIAGMTRSSGAAGQPKTLEELKQEDLHLATPPPPGTAPDPNAPRWVHRHSAVATIISLPTDRLPCYPSCPEQVEAAQRATQASTQAPPVSRPCAKKVAQEAGGWRCAMGHMCAQPVYRYLCRLQVMDHSESIEVNLFDDQAKKLFGVDASAYAEAFESDAVEEINKRALWRRVSMKLRSTKEVWQESERVKVILDEAADIDFKTDGRRLLADIHSCLGPSVMA